MKIKVTRQLSAGIYYVSFSFTEFTADELSKMGAFGVPAIEVQYGVLGNRRSAWLGINQIGPNHNPGFATEDEAKAYEQSVLGHARTAMEALRQRKDDFTSSEEVAI